MLAYLVNFIHAFIPMALIAGMLVAAIGSEDGKKTVRTLLLIIGCGIVTGAVVFTVSRQQGALTATRTGLHAAALLSAIVHAGFLSIGGKRLTRVSFSAAASFAGLLAAAGAFSFSSFVAEQALSASAVLNTDLILNIGGILFGMMLIGLLIPLIAEMSAKAGRAAFTGIMLLAALLLVAQWGADLLLGMMRLEMLELTSLRVSIVAKVAKYSRVFPYVNAALALVLSNVYFRQRRRIAEDAPIGKAEQRKVRSLAITESRWFRCSVACTVLAVSCLLYHDLYASRPPRISKPVNLKPDANGMIRVKVEELADGVLHRYSYITEDGHVVRFFMLNRSGGKKIGVVYDACMMCGDMGYIQEKNEVICIACNVRIFIPSIGKAGGCNPIPLVHTMANGEVVVSAEELDKGARYFSEVIKVKVKDPVTHKEVDSGTSPHRYEYKGRIYFFESAESLEKFKVAPDTYVGTRESRYFRAQGYQQS